MTHISIIASINLLAMAAERVRSEVARCVEVIGRDAGTSYARAKTSCSVLVEDIALLVDQTDGGRRYRSRRSYTTAFCVCHEHKLSILIANQSCQRCTHIICARGYYNAVNETFCVHCMKTHLSFYQVFHPKKRSTE